jgi:hypothetical protein
MGRSQEAASLLKAGAAVDARDGSKLTPKELLTTDFGTTNFIASHIHVANDLQFDWPVSSALDSRKQDFALHFGLVVLALPHPSASRDTRTMVGSKPAISGLPEIHCHHNRDLDFPATRLRIRSPLYGDRQAAKRATNPNYATLIARSASAHAAYH